MISQLSHVWRHLQDAGVRLPALLPANLHNEPFFNNAQEVEFSLTQRLAQQERSWETRRLLYRSSQTALVGLVCVTPRPHLEA